MQTLSHAQPPAFPAVQIPADHATCAPGAPPLATLRDPILEFGDHGRSYTTMHIYNFNLLVNIYFDV